VHVTHLRLLSHILGALSLLCATSAAFAAEVKLDWDPVAGADGYKLYYDFDAPEPPYDGTQALEGPSPLTTTAPGVTLNLPSCQRVWFSVTAFNSAGESAYAAPIESVVIEGPQDVRVHAGAGNGTAEVTWSPLDASDTGTLSHYELHYDYRSWERCGLDAACRLEFATTPRDQNLLDACEAAPACQPVWGAGANEGDSPLAALPLLPTQVSLTGLATGRMLTVAVEAFCADGTSAISVESTGAVGVSACSGVSTCEVRTVCLGDTLVLCELDAAGCLMEVSSTDCTASGTGGTCDSSHAPKCTNNEGCSDTCNPGSSCVGDTLSRCLPGPYGCLESFAMDCAAVEQGTCDPIGLRCGRACDGVSDCFVEGARCEGDTLVLCAQDASGCLVTARIGCALVGQTCDAAAAACSGPGDELTSDVADDSLTDVASSGDGVQEVVGVCNCALRRARALPQPNLWLVLAWLGLFAWVRRRRAHPSRTKKKVVRADGSFVPALRLVATCSETGPADDLSTTSPRTCQENPWTSARTNTRSTANPGIMRPIPTRSSWRKW